MNITIADIAIDMGIGMKTTMSMGIIDRSVLVVVDVIADVIAIMNIRKAGENL